jgi:hypothetical protein
METTSLTNTPDKDLMLYAVLKLQQDILYQDPVTNETQACKIDGIAGYMPIFHTIEEAEQASESMIFWLIYSRFRV